MFKNMTWKKWLLYILIAIIILILGFLATPMGRDVVRIASVASDLQSAKITDTNLYQPQVPIGETCKTIELPLAKEAPSEKMAAALTEAKAYSDGQKGVGLIVMKDGEVIHESYNGDIDGETPTDSFSMHKSLLALVFGAALQDKIIGSLDDPVGDYIDEWADDPRGKIALRQFLNMESGLELGSPTSLASLRLLLGSDINGIALDKPVTDAPETVFKYNNANSQIAGIALTRALKKAGHSGYASYLDKKIWCPVGGSKAHLWFDSEDGAPHYFAGVFSGLRNWARIGELIRNEGKVGEKTVLPAEWFATMRQPAKTNPNYGLHIWLGSPEGGKRKYSPESKVAVIHSAPYLADDVVFFDGFGGQRVYVIPSAGLTIARTGQVDFEYDDAKIVNLLLAALKE